VVCGDVYDLRAGIGGSRGSRRGVRPLYLAAIFETCTGTGEVCSGNSGPNSTAVEHAATAHANSAEEVAWIAAPGRRFQRLTIRVHGVHSAFSSCFQYLGTIGCKF
jgi:hypothetical protein